MNAERLGRLARMLRVRERQTQVTLAARAGVSRQAVSLLERGRARELRIGTVESIFNALGARFDARVQWNGPELERLLDAGHAGLAAHVKRRLERWHWHVRVEVSYSRYGERGRIDLLAWHPISHALAVIELKTQLVDVQDLLGSLDAKARLSRGLAERFGWTVTQAVPFIVFSDGKTTRRRIEALEPLFERYSLRGRACISWLRQPTAPTTGGMWFVTLPMSASRARSAQRVRRAVTLSAKCAPRRAIGEQRRTVTGPPRTDSVDRSAVARLTPRMHGD